MLTKFKLENSRNEHNEHVEKNPESKLGYWGLGPDPDDQAPDEYFIQDPVLRMQAMGLNVRRA